VSFDTSLFKQAMGTFATGVTIVSGIEDGGPVGFTCQSFMSLSIDPPFIGVAPDRQRGDLLRQRALDPPGPAG
jgi:flavin reductase (DIM6/NTAB) family NADH-FMN oxidoreductase RutF